MSSGGGGGGPPGRATTVYRPAEVLPLLPRATVAPAGKAFCSRLKVRGSLFTRLSPLSVQPLAALSQAGRVAMLSLKATSTLASAVTVKVARVAPVKALESLAVRIQAEPATLPGTAVKVKARSPYWALPCASPSRTDQSPALAVSFTTRLAIRPGGGGALVLAATV
jgi:hypothetical protein